MSKLSSRRTLAACLALAILSTIVFAVSRSGWVTPPRRPVKVTYQSSYVMPDGKVKPGSILVRTVSNGQMRRQEFRDGKLYIDQYVGTDGTLYGVSHKRRELNPAGIAEKFNLNAPPQTAETLKAQKQFHRTEQLLGLTAYVFQIYAEKGVLVKELWFSPETDPLTLKEISFRDDGSQSIVEATTVEYDNVGEVRPAGYKVK